MDFQKTLSLLITAFHKESINYCLIGGFALGLWGFHRATADLDFLVLNEDMNKLDAIFQNLAFSRIHRSENVSQYEGPIAPLGSVDILHAFRERSLNILKRAVYRTVLDDLELKTATPEDLIGLKLQALSNADRTSLYDLPDIEAVFQKLGPKLDLTIVVDYFKFFNKVELWNRLQKQYLK